MAYLYLATIVALIVSSYKDPDKTFLSIKIALKKFKKFLPPFLTMLIFVSIILFLVPDRIILKYINNNSKFLSVIIASFFGSISLMPGFIAFPLCRILLEKGVPYMVLSAFSTSLMMVGVLTYPLEKAYFGTKVTIIRNSISFLIALIVALAIGLFFGEVSL